MARMGDHNIEVMGTLEETGGSGGFASDASSAHGAQPRRSPIKPRVSKLCQALSHIWERWPEWATTTSKSWALWKRPAVRVALRATLHQLMRRSPDGAQLNPAYPNFVRLSPTSGSDGQNGRQHHRSHGHSGRDQRFGWLCERRFISSCGAAQTEPN